MNAFFQSQVQLKDRPEPGADSKFALPSTITAMQRGYNCQAICSFQPYGQISSIHDWMFITQASDGVFQKLKSLVPSAWCAQALSQDPGQLNPQGTSYRHANRVPIKGFLINPCLNAHNSRMKI